MISYRPGKQIQIWHAFFSFFFLLYAISPLTYTLPEKGWYESAYDAQRPTLASTSIHVLLMELLAESFSFSAEHRQNPGDDTILIRKKRAMMPEDPAAKLLSSEQTAIPPYDCTPLARTSEGPTVPQAAFRATPVGFHSLYAGHSPPAL